MPETVTTWPAGCILSLMPSTATFHESRQSTRVSLKVVITVEGAHKHKALILGEPLGIPQPLMHGQHHSIAAIMRNCCDPGLNFIQGPHP